MNQNAGFEPPWYEATEPAGESAHAGGGIELFLATVAVFLAPFNILRLDAFYFTASDLFMLAALSARLFSGSFSFAPLGAATPLWNGGMMILSGTLLLSSLSYGDINRGLILLSQYCFAYLLLPYVILARPWSQTVVLMKAFVLSVGLMCVHGIYVMNIVAERNTMFVSGSGRLLGFVERENECAALIALTAPMVLWLTACGKAPGWWRWLLLPLFAYGVALAGSNTGLIGLVLGIAAFVILTASIWRIAVMGCISVAGVFALLTWAKDLLPTVFQQRVLEALQSGDIDQAGTFAGRMELIHEAMGLADRSLLLGFGADQYRVISSHGAPVHNTYLLLWTEAGLLGLVGFVLMILAVATVTFSAFRIPEGRVSAVCALTTISLFATLANAFPHLYARFFVVPLMLGIAPCLTLLRYGSEQPGETSTDDGDARPPRESGYIHGSQAPHGAHG